MKLPHRMTAEELDRAMEVSLVYFMAAFSVGIACLVGVVVIEAIAEALS